MTSRRDYFAELIRPACKIRGAKIYGQLRTRLTFLTGLAIGSLLLFCQMPQTVQASTTCASPSTAQKQIVGTIQDMFTALRTDDLQSFQTLVAPDFYAYDGGMRFSAPALADLIKKAHASGKRWEWSVTNADTHVECDLAWITYVNQGSVEDATGRQATAWLESAVLRYSDARWHILFLHSTRASPP